MKCSNKIEVVVGSFSDLRSLINLKNILFFSQLHTNRYITNEERGEPRMLHLTRVLLLSPTSGRGLLGEAHHAPVAGRSSYLGAISDLHRHLIFIWFTYSRYIIQYSMFEHRDDINVFVFVMLTSTRQINREGVS